MAPAPSPPTSLPVIVLNHPFILLPHNRISVSLAQDQVEPLLELIQANGDTPLLVAAVPEMKKNGQSASWGCAARITRLARPAPGRRNYLATLLGVVRVRIDNLANDTISLPQAGVTYFPSGGPGASSKTLEQFRSVATGLIDRQLRIPANAQGDVLITRSDWRRLKSLLDQEERVGFVADILMGIVHLEWQDRYDFLANGDVSTRLERAAVLLSNQMAISEVSQKITSAVDESLSKQQKEFFLRQQLSAIQKELTDLHRGTNAPGRRDGVIGGGSELDDEDESGGDYAELRKRIDALAKGTEVRAMAVREFKRLKRIPPNSVENGVIRSYLEWLTALPWPSASQPIQEETLAVLRDPQFLSNARKQLDSDHFGLDKIKRRLIEHLAIIRIKELHRAATNNTTTNTPSKSSTIKAPILLLVGPPGVGKTSIASSLARTLQRPFNRISLGGVRDEAEIRGHRRTYVASGPGAIVQALRKAGRPDSVILLDEIDKVGHSSFHGDPSAALLEVLDPEQNHTFKDHYIDVPIDLSQTLFIATANTLDTIPAPLLDRCEVIQLSGYTYDEKLSIARRYLLPKQLAQNGLPAEQLELTEAAMLQLATGYTRESGVRSLEREIGAVVRYKTVEWADHQDAAVQAPYEKQVTEADLIKILGMPRWENEERDREERRGIAWGLVVMGEGQGGILPVETLTTPGSGKLMLTGSLGEVIRESGELALSWVKSHAYQLGITKSRYEDPLKMTDRGAIDIHLHLPSGAQKKDGPSAGVAMVCAFVSLLSGYTMPTNLAMTGEITLRGRVTAVGGIKEKVLGAYRGGMSKLILPYANRKDVEQDVAPEIRDAMEFVFVKSVEEALEAAFGIGTLGRSGMGPILVESRL